MEDTTLPTTKLSPKRFKVDPNKITLISPSTFIRTPTRSFSFLCFFAFLFLLCTLIFLVADPRIYRSAWFKNILHKSPQFPSYLPDFIFYDQIHTTPSPAPKRNKTLARLRDKAWLHMISHCDLFDGRWVKTDLPPLYKGGSCPLMEESFNCYRNGRPDTAYENYIWQPHGCYVPRLDGRKLLKLLRRKRTVFVGDSLNRNVWEAMICLLMNSVKDRSRVFEASGKNEFKKEGAYSFIFLDYNCSVEFIRSAFLVQEWEIPLSNGSTKETLRIDMADRSYETAKDADVLIFNTGNWWTHEKTSEGKDFYQEGDHVYEHLGVEEAFEKAMTTWAKWIEDNIDPKKTKVFFRGYSFSHFSKGEWNTGGRCDEKDPIVNAKDLLNVEELSPPIPQMLDKAMDRVKIPVYYQNVTTMTNYRRDAHPSLFRKPDMTEEEKLIFETHQDCSHWCLPGVPDTWNELLFTQLLFIHKQKTLKMQTRKMGQVHP